MKTLVKIKSIYDKPAPEDGCRVLVDRLWPRGMTREAAALDEWAKELAPSTDLRKWFGHSPALWAGFQQRYKEELRKNETVAPFVEAHRKDKLITLLYAAKDHEHNQAVVLHAYLQQVFDKAKDKE